ncbi:MAG: hypothetical protein V2I48_07100 [Xanthomonadales bacterium]|nr:hypothetical protein [Xanthomonadales bacterium]
MSSSYVTIAVEFTDLEDIYPLLEVDSQAGRQAAFLSFISEGFDAEYEEDLLIEDIAFEGGWFIIEFQSSTELCNEITHTLFEGLSEQGGKKIMALEYNSRIGTFSCMVPGYDEAEYADDCFDDFDGMMHDLEEIMDRREQLLHILELAETEPVRSSLRELLGEEDDEGLEAESEEEDVQEEDDEEDPDDEEFDKFEEELENAAFEEDSEPGSVKSNALMDELRQALADGDEERANELFEQIQRQ